MLHYLKLFYAATTLLSPAPLRKDIEHLLTQMGPLEKTEQTIEHMIKKAQYNEKNPPPNIAFEATIPFEWFPHCCNNECGESFTHIKQLILKLHSAVAQNKFKTVFNFLSEHPKLCEFLDSEKNTVLHTAISCKHTNLTLAILCHYPQLITHYNKQDKTPIHMALTGNPRKVLLLVRAAYATK